MTRRTAGLTRSGGAPDSDDSECAGPRGSLPVPDAASVGASSATRSPSRSRWPARAIAGSVTSQLSSYRDGDSDAADELHSLAGAPADSDWHDGAE